MSQLTTHVLDTALGKPAVGLTLRLMSMQNGNWQLLAEGVTNSDGRIAQLLPSGHILPSASYKMVFETGAYFTASGRPVFYPVVEILFNISDSSHYHIPLLLSPFGYTTYRGS
jgi:hydroxyisourate hydrolase